MTPAIVVERPTAGTPRAVFESCARIHREEIHEGFLSTLGDRFLTTLYRTLAGSPYSFLMVARSGSDVAGFICGSTDVGRVYRDFAWRAGPRVIPLLLPRLLSPRRIVKLLETLIYPSRQAKADLPPAEILNFCVTHSAQRSGVGRILFAALAAEFRRRKVSRIRIVTGANQRTAQAFYERIGARLVGEVAVHRGSPELVYIYDINDAASIGAP